MKYLRRNNNNNNNNNHNHNNNDDGDGGRAITESRKRVLELPPRRGHRPVSRVSPRSRLAHGNDLG